MDANRLDRCPVCCYDLAGLPAAHRCPECGFEYDETMTVFREELTPIGVGVRAAGAAVIAGACCAVLQITGVAPGFTVHRAVVFTGPILCAYVVIALGLQRARRRFVVICARGILVGRRGEGVLRTVPWDSLVRGRDGGTDWVGSELPEIEDFPQHDVEAELRRWLG